MRKLTRREALGSGFGIAAAFLLSGCRSPGETPLPPDTVNVGKTPHQILSTIAKSHEPLYVEEARAYIAAFPKDSVPAAKLVYSTSLHEGLDFGLIGLSQVCTHLACKTSFCKSSGWFECFCHGGKFNGVGEKTGGPPPRGLDQVRLSLDERGSVVVHTGRTFDGRPVGKGVVHIGAIGPLCD